MALVALAVALRAHAQCPDGSPLPCAPVRTIPPLSVAVLGFRPLGGDAGDALLGEGLAEELSSRLGQLGRLTVTSRSAVRRLRNVETMPVARIGQSLGVTFLVQGTVRRAGSRMRITAELLRAATGAVAWSDQYDRVDSDILLMQEAVSMAVAEAVGGRLLPAERTALGARPTKSTAAYEAYLRARALYVSDPTLTGVDAAVHELQRAIRLDEGFASAWAWLSIMHSWAFWSYFDRTESRLDSALHAANRARALAPAAGLTHLAFGDYYYWGRLDYSRALQELTAALAADPREPQIHVAIANVARRLGDFELSLASRNRAIDLDPTNAGEIGERAATLRVMRRYDEAEQDFRRSQAVSPDLANVHLYRAQIAVMRDGEVREPALLDSVAAHVAVAIRNTVATTMSMVVWRLPGPHQSAALAAVPEGVTAVVHHLIRGVVLSARADVPAAASAFDAARRRAQDGLRDRPNDSFLEAVLAQAYAGLGQCDTALAHAELAASLLPIERDAFTGPTRQETLAEIEARCGRAENAIDRLARLLGLPSNITRARLRADPAFAAMRDHPRFIELVKEP